MFSLRYIIALATTLLFLFGCTKSENNESKDQDIRISGSDTELALVEDIAALYNENDAKLSIDISGGGSEIGITELIEGKAHIANSSRPIRLHERELIEEKGIEIKEQIIAIDAVSIICHPKLGIQALSTLDLSNIFTGRVQNWKELGGPDLPITIMGRDENSGTRSFLEQRFARYEGFAANHHECASNAAVVEQVKKTKGTIGYVGVGYILNSIGRPIQSVWTMEIYVEGGETHSPYEMLAVSQNKYELTRPLYQYINTANDKALRFAEFVKSELSHEVVRAHGFYLSAE